MPVLSNDPPPCAIDTTVMSASSSVVDPSAFAVGTKAALRVVAEAASEALPVPIALIAETW